MSIKYHSDPEVLSLRKSRANITALLINIRAIQPTGNFGETIFRVKHCKNTFVLHRVNTSQQDIKPKSVSSSLKLKRVL